MKKLFIIWLAIIFSVAVYPAAAQVKSDFSDWNVPPPVPPSTLPKQPNKNNAIVLSQTDVPIPGQPVSGPVILPASGPVITGYLIVEAPSQPQFEGAVQQGNSIPQPAVPEPLDPPKPAPNDQPDDNAIVMPGVAAPNMPPMPQFPDAGTGIAIQKTPALPILPAMVRPVTGGNISGNLFPFKLWAIPAIPGSVPIQKPDLNPGTTNSKGTKPAAPLKNKKYTQ